MSMQIATRVDDEQAALFKETTRQLGTTPADALRMFISAFNDYRGFPYGCVCHEMTWSRLRPSGTLLSMPVVSP